jgi:hypothetical protein
MKAMGIMAGPPGGVMRAAPMAPAAPNPYAAEQAAARAIMLQKQQVRLRRDRFSLPAS